MEKELLVSKLKEKIGSTNVSDKTIGAYVEALMPTITSDEMVNDTFLASHASVVKIMGGQISHDASVEINKYKEQNKIDDKGQKGTDGLGVIQSMLEDIKKENQSLKERLDQKDSESLKADLVKKVMEGMKAKGANDAYVLKKAMQGVDIDVNKSVDELVETYLPLYDNEYKEARGNGEPPRSSTGGGGAKGDDILDDYFSQKIAEGKFPAKQE